MLILWFEIGGRNEKKIYFFKINLNLSFDNRITPRLMQTCRANLIQYCHLPDKWIVDEKMDDVYIGKYLSCLYENKQAVQKKHAQFFF